LKVACGKVKREGDIEEMMAERMCIAVCSCVSVVDGQETLSPLIVGPRLREVDGAWWICGDFERGFLRSDVLVVVSRMRKERKRCRACCLRLVNEIVCLTEIVIGIHCSKRSDLI
jgi:hypothetical protein